MYLMSFPHFCFLSKEPSSFSLSSHSQIAAIDVIYENKVYKIKGCMKLCYWNGSGSLPAAQTEQESVTQMHRGLELLYSIQTASVLWGSQTSWSGV